MATTKLTIENNFLVVQRYNDSDELIGENNYPTKSVYLDAVQGSTYELKYVDSGNNVTATPFIFSELRDSTGTEFADEDTFKAWNRANLGKSSAGDGGATYIEEGDNVTITGDGSEGDPYVINSAGGATLATDIVNALEAANTPSTGNYFITLEDLPDTSVYVPYSGATGNVNLGANSITAANINALTPYNLVSSIGATMSPNPATTRYFQNRTYTGSGATITLQTLANGLGSTLVYTNTGSGNLTINANGGTNDIWTAGSASNSYVLAPNATVRLYCDGSRYIVNP